MRIRFHKKSGLGGIVLKTDWDDIGYNPRSTRGLKEYMLIARNGIPD